jgi:hypothetical protein
MDINHWSLKLKSLRETYRCFRELQRSVEWRVRIKRRHRLIRRLSLRERHRRVRTVRIARRPHYDHRAIAHQASETPTKAKHLKKHIREGGEGGDDERTLPSSPVVDRQYYAEHLGQTKFIIRNKVPGGGVHFHRRVCGVWCTVGFERTSRGIAFYVGLDAHRLLS